METLLFIYQSYQTEERVFLLFTYSAYDHWYLALDSYLTRGLMSGTHSRGMKIRIITPNNTYNIE